MGRQPRVEVHEDGSASLRIRIGPSTWRLVEAYGKSIGADGQTGLRALQAQIEALISAGNASWLSSDWQAILREFKAPSRLPADFDATKLHRSDRTKSGFVGVYANGAGFRATGRAGAYIGTFQRAEVAAWERYLYYQRNDLPYGELEVAVDEERKRGTQGTDAELREIVLDTAHKSGTSHLYEGEGEIQMAGFGPGGIAEASAALQLHDAEAERPARGRSIAKGGKP